MKRILLTLLFLASLAVSASAQLSQATVSGTVYDLSGAVKSGVKIRVVRVTQSGSNINANVRLETTSAVDGTWSLTVPRSSTAWFCSPNSSVISGMSSDCNRATAKTIPNASSALFQNLTTVVSFPTGGFTVYDEAVAFANPVTTLKFTGAGVTATETSAGIATINITSGGSGAWGAITGTLSDQTDLQTALDAKQASDADLTTIAGLSPSNDDVLQRKAGGWVNRSIAQLKTDLGYAAIATSGSADDLASGTVPLARLSGITTAELSATAGITNAQLAGSIANNKLSNSGITIGSTPVSLGAAATTIAGLTLTTPTIANFNDANHDHEDSTGGGQLTTAALTGLGTGVATALGVNVGSAGAPVLFDGAGGTPSGIVLTNASGLPPTTGISGWPANSSGVLTNDGSGGLSWGAGGSGLTVGTTAIASGTATRLLYETSGNVLGEISGATSNGTNVTFGSGNLLATSPVFTTDITTPLVKSAAGDNLALNATAPAAANGASQAGKNVTITASAAVASTDTSGAAAGGNVSVLAGNAAVFTTGSALGGTVTVQSGRSIGTGSAAWNAIVIQSSDETTNARSGDVVIKSGNMPANATRSSGDVLISAGGYSSGTNTTATPGRVAITGALGQADTAANGDPGGQILITGGVGGASSFANTAAGGTGGALSLISGAGGAQTANGNSSQTLTGGAGGAYAITGGAGGAANGTAASTTHIGGAGASVTVTGGVGGTASGASGTNTGGDGGNLYLLPGAGGAGTTAAGASGNLYLGYNGSTARGEVFLGATQKLLYGSGSPESVVTAPVGSLYLRSDGGTNTTLYVKESGTGNTGWAAK